MGKSESWHSKYASQLILESTKSRRASRIGDTSDDGRSRNTSTIRKSLMSRNSDSSSIETAPKTCRSANNRRRQQ